MKIILAISTVSLFNFVRGEPLFCQIGSNPSADGLTCECVDSNLYYSAVYGKCLSICEYYGDVVCGYYNNAICEDFPTNVTGYTCSCPQGYIDSGDGYCVYDDNCANVICQDNEVCVNFGSYVMVTCREGYYRTENGTCAAIDYCLKQSLNSCTQQCNSLVDAKTHYTCSCFDGYYLAGSSVCAIDSNHGFTTCFCGDNIACSQASNGTKYCTPLPGYLFDGDNQNVKDIDECLTGNYQCQENSTCVNTIGSYECSCDDPNFSSSSDLAECVEITCPPGKVSWDRICVSPCDATTWFCPPNTICGVNDQAIPFCMCQLSCQVDGWNAITSFSVYHMTFERTYEVSETEQDKFTIIRSMEHIFGIGNAELLPFAGTGKYVHIDVGVSAPVTNTSYLESIISDLCYEMKSFAPGKCILPGGIVIYRDSISVTTKDPCNENSNLCSSGNAICSSVNSSISSGTYQCVCKDGFEKTQNPYGDFYCNDINECLIIQCENGSVCLNNEGNYACISLASTAEEVLTYLTTKVNELKIQIQVLEFQIENLNSEIQNDNSTIEQLNGAITDEQKKTAVVGGVVGALFGIAILALIAGGTMYYFKRK